VRSRLGDLSHCGVLYSPSILYRYSPPRGGLALRPLPQYIPARGRQKNRRTPPVHLLNLRPTHPPSDFFFLDFSFSKFLRVSRQGEFKNTIQIFWQKVRVENFSQYFDKNFDVSFSSTSFVLSHFRVFFSDESSKALQKTFCKKNRVEQFLQKIRPKVQNRLLLDFFLVRFWAFLGKGSSKTRLIKKSTKQI
jgi:hypothetical protein